jgi:hypothetical protein
MDQSAVSELLAAATGGAAPELSQRLLMEAAGALGLSGDPNRADENAMKIAAALQTLQAAAPRDPLEAMLAVQMAGCHAAAMRALRRAAECSDYPQIEALYARQAARLMTLFMRQTEALEKRRAQQAAAQSARDADMRDTRHDADAPSPSPHATHPEPVEGCSSGEAPPAQAREEGASAAAAPPGDTSFDRLRTRHVWAGDAADDGTAPRNGRRHPVNGIGRPA